VAESRADYRHVRYTSRGPVARLTLDDPSSRNAYTSAMCAELVDGIERFSRDDSLRVLVVTGAGDAFCSGGNLRSSEEVEEAERRVLGHAAVMREGMHRVVLALHRLDKPVIAMVNGPAVAGGLALALACDLRVAGDRARLGDPSGRVGLLPDEGGVWLFPRAMGLDAALRMSWLNEVYGAEEALRLGLVTEVVEHEGLEARVEELAAALAERAPLAVRMVKRLMRRGLGLSLEDSLGDAELAVLTVNESRDVREGVAAFIERRSPEFEGR
jgi:2-(1,2-epoxy-1,2-dihydrophenyl)acetyl-CoA isomerase